MKKSTIAFRILIFIPLIITITILVTELIQLPERLNEQTNLVPCYDKYNNEIIDATCTENATNKIFYDFSWIFIMLIISTTFITFTYPTISSITEDEK